MRLNHVTIGSHDVARAASFYKQLGLQPIVDALPRYVRFACPEGGSTFSVHHVEGPLPSGTIVYFECEDLDERVMSLKASGVVFEQDPVDRPWLWREAHLRDPDGNPICLFFAGMNRLDPPWRL